MPRHARSRRLSGLRSTQELQSNGIQPARILRIMQVQLLDMDVPAWAIKKAVKGLPLTSQTVWLRRKDGNALARYSGASCLTMETEHRACTLCQRPLLGVEAAERRRQIESDVTARQLPCGDTCIEAQRDGRWK